MLALPLIAVLATQGIHARFDSIPDLTLGQKIRVSIAVPAPLLPIGVPAPGFRTARVAGTLIEYRPYESVAVRRTGWIAGLGPTDERTIDWVGITRIDAAQPRNGINVVQGALGGAVAAVFAAAMARYLIGGFCHNPHEPAQCPSVWSMTKDVALYTVPIGAVIGLFSTRWKPVYLRH